MSKAEMAKSLTLYARLAAPFEASEIKCKPQTVSGNRALAVFYVDARLIQDRLDEVVGPPNWQATFNPLPDGNVICRLSLRIDGEWIAKEDVGSQSEQPDEGDRRKAAFSDALKRAAVQWGIGRYLYRSKPQWVDWDAQNRKFARQPVLPSSMLPAATPKPMQPKAGDSAVSGPPQSVGELKRRIYEKQENLKQTGLCKEGELVNTILLRMQEKGHGHDWANDWHQGDALKAITTIVKQFEKEAIDRFEKATQGAGQEVA